MQYQLSKERYKELEYFCLQYNYKKQIKNKDSAEGRKARIDIGIINHVATIVSSELAKYIVENVSTGKSWEQIAPPCGRRQFYFLRRKFFYLLSKIK